MIYSKQKLYCNTCGKALLVEIARPSNFDGRFCSMECCKEFEWRKILSNMNSEYYPRTTEND